LRAGRASRTFAPTPGVTCTRRSGNLGGHPKVLSAASGRCGPETAGNEVSGAADGPALPGCLPEKEDTHGNGQ